MDEPLITPLREDLIFFPAPPEQDGAPVWMLQDPVSGDFLRADWAHFEILKRLDRPQHFCDLTRRLEEQTTLRLPEEELRAFLQDLMLRGLLRARLLREAGELQEERTRSRLSPWQWFLRNYLYFRVPLLRPDDFLERTAPVARRLLCAPVFAALGLLLLCGLYVLSQRFDLYVNTAVDFLNWKGALAFGVSMAAVKAVHEFAHAYAAKLTGNRVPAMGLAFIVLWPVPYCDVTDSWRMSSRRRRLLISSAGILCELALAGAALVLWGVCESPLAKGIFFMLSSASLLGTLLVNLNPAMRFDGYYLFCDLLGIDNLYARSADYLRWRYRGGWFGINAPDPEPQAGRRLRIIFLLYAAGSWVYRFFLYLGIALVVYHSFPKLVGIVLFALEILLFLVRPAWAEARALWRLRARMRPRVRGLAAGGAAGALLVWVALPLPRYTGIPAAYEPARLQVLYTPLAGTLVQLDAVNGKAVRAGEVVAVLRSQTVEYALAQAEARAAAALARLRRAQTQDGAQLRLRELTRQLAGEQAQVEALRRHRESCAIRADFDGVISNWPDAAVAGASLPARQPLGLVCSLGPGRVLGYLEAELAEYVPTSARGRFVPAWGGAGMPVQMEAVAPVRERQLRHTALSTAQGGDISLQPARSADGAGATQRKAEEISGNYLLLQARELPTSEPAAEASLPSRGGQSGTLWFWSAPRSYLAAQGRAIWRTVMRESGL